MKTLVINILVLFILININASAQPNGRNDGLGRRMANLKLTDEQLDKVKSIRLEHQKEMVDLKAELEKERIKGSEIRNDNINRSEYLSHVDKMNSLRNKISTAQAEHRMDVYELLTPEQKKLWNDNDFKGKGFRQGRHGNHDRQGLRDGRGFRGRNCW